jgi:hypothetical protein
MRISSGQEMGRGRECTCCSTLLVSFRYEAIDGIFRTEDGVAGRGTKLEAASLCSLIPGQLRREDTSAINQTPDKPDGDSTGYSLLSMVAIVEKMTIALVTS